MSEAVYRAGDENLTLQVAQTVGAYNVIQLPTGEAAFLNQATGLSTNDYSDQFRTRGKATVEKTTGVVLLPGQDVYWDHSANKAHYKKVNDRDFFVGVATDEAASGALTVSVDLNKRQRYDIDVARDGFLTSITGTQGLNTMGLFRRGGAHKFLLSATNEAQKVDILSVDGFAVGANAIVEAIFRVVSDGAGTVVDANVGVASATHATDADSIAEHLFCHLDANNVNINFQSKDGVTTVASTDSTQDYTEGSAVANRVHVLFDLRNPSDIQVYVNAAKVLDSTVFRLDNAAGPLFLLAHVEKSASTDTYEFDLDSLRCWLSEQ